MTPAQHRPPLDAHHRLVAKLIDPLRVQPGVAVVLPGGFDAAHKAGLVTKHAAAEALRETIELLTEYQARLAARDTYGLLVVIQALDAAGKDGTIRHVMSGVNPAGVRVHSFKVPSVEERKHDYLWRYSKALPTRGEIDIFNRSHYEEVLVVRVHPEYLHDERLPAEARENGVWRRRFDEINNWARCLVDNGIRIVKLFLNVSKEETPPGPRPRRRAGQELESSLPPMLTSAALGTTISAPTLTCCRTPAPTAPRGTSFPPTTNGSVGSPLRRSSVTHFCASTPTIPTSTDNNEKNWPRPELKWRLSDDAATRP